MANFSIITVSREVESYGDEIAEKLSQKLKMELLGKEKFVSLLRDISPQFPTDPPEDEKERDRWIIEVGSFLSRRAAKKPFILVGRGGQKILENCPFAFHILVVASQVTRLRRTMEKYQQDEVTASRILAEQDQQRERFLRQTFGIDWRDPVYYHLVVNTDFYGVNEATDLILEAQDKVVTPPQPKKVEEQPLFPREDLGQRITFSHPSEEEFARVLDFYGVRWLYEPRTFPLEWDEEGNLSEAFAPDFYLPDFDLFIELTTQKQKLTRKKNRKVRRLRELYPQVKIRVVYARDYEYILNHLKGESNE
ncbi:MAG TPA: cytidylate kinase family protein [Candidatus Atribacteria bacterium]|nr:cytidylate kinase family protein [Candidatus Atribacteria bacterium]HPZ39610.1 cytidylate kinase family protein [Candidatus Atribacteria bacterium]